MALTPDQQRRMRVRRMNLLMAYASFASSKAVAWTPAELFAQGEQGVWYDPSDMTTLFQDAAGTIPVTAVEQPVGLMLDKSQNGVGTNGAKRVNLLTYSEQFDNAAWTTNVATITQNAATAPDGTTTADEIVATSASGTSAVGVAQTVSVTNFVTYSVCAKANTATKIRLTMNSLAVWFDLANGAVLTQQAGVTGATTSLGNGWYRCTVTTTSSVAVTSVLIRLASADNTANYTGTIGDSLYVWGADLRLTSEAATSPTYQRIVADWASTQAGNHASQSTSASRPVLSARVNTLVNTDTLSTQSVTTLATNYTLRFEGTGSIALSGTGSGTYSAGSHTVTCTAGTLTLTVTGSVTNADLRVANAGVNLPAYQRVGAATAGTSTTAGNADYDTTGFPMYLRFDGTDDGMATGTINPGSVDKAQVFAGVRKLSDAARGIVCELSESLTTNTNGFLLAAPTASLQDYGFTSVGTLVSGATAGTYVAPITNILTGIGDISGDRATLRVNGSQVAQSTTDQGTGNYNNYPLFVGRRGGASLPFSGHLYSLIARFSATNLPDATIAQTETWVAGKTGAY